MRGKLAHWAEDAARRAAAVLSRPFHTQQRELSEHMRRLFTAHRVDCAFDVGAHRGKYRRFLRYEVGFGGLVVSVEPIAELAAALEMRARHTPLWQVHHCALGAAPGKAVLNVMASSDFSSFLAPEHSATAQYAARNVVERKVEVEVRTLEQLAAGLAQQPRSIFLKLDTQGYDLEVLRGAGRSLESVVALQSEVPFQPIYAGMPDWRKSITRITELGFSLAGLYAVSRDASLRLIEADCVFVRSR